MEGAEGSVCPQDRGEGVLQRAGCGSRGQADPGGRFGKVTLGMAR